MIDVAQLKKDYPNTWKQFFDYLRKNYEFWENPTSEKTLWFCERSPLTQLGYFLGWLDTLNIYDKIDASKSIYYHKFNEAESNIMEINQIGILMHFEYLEKHL